MIKRLTWVWVPVVILFFSAGFGLGVVTSATSGPDAPPPLESLLRRLGIKTGTDVRSFERAWDEIHSSFLRPDLNDQDLVYGATRGLVEALDDPYSVFLDPLATNDFQQEVDGTFEGLGMEIGLKDDRLTIIAPLSDSPAARAGLRAGDVILSIDDQDAGALGLTKAVQAIRGQRGTTVDLEIERQGKTLSFTVKRDVIRIESVTGRVEQRSGKKIGYLRISQFSSDTNQQFQREARALVNQSVGSLVLDLRNNPGGLLEQSLKVASAFLDDQVIVQELDRSGQVEEHRSEGLAWLGAHTLVVLVNEGSASAAEIVAGALQDHQRARVIGQTTFGKGTVQDFQILPDGSSLKLTIAKWLTPGGRSIEEQGIVPDQLVEQPEDATDDPQLEAAFSYVLGL